MTGAENPMLQSKIKILCVAFAVVVLLIHCAIAQDANPFSVLPIPEELNGGYSATRQLDGRWLIAGGHRRQRSGFGRGPDGKSLWGPGNASEQVILFDPTTSNWTNTGAMTTKHSYHRATLLADGRVLVTGGVDTQGDLSSAEIYDPASGEWTKTGSLNIVRRSHTSTLLADGRVLVAGGVADGTNYNPHFNSFASAELYDPATEKWTMTTPMSVARFGHAAILLTNGLVLAAGGKELVRAR